jgi:hypothetical protein
VPHHFFFECRAQVRVLSGAPIAGESALTSGYLLVEAQAPLPGKPRGVGGKNGDAGSGTLVTCGNATAD